MASITYWNRLIPQPLGTSLEPGLRAQVRDPVWILARQLQLGEYLAVDGGSPAFVDIDTRTMPFARSGQPLEPITMSEPVTPDLALRIELGEVLESMIVQMVNPVTLTGTAKSRLRTMYPLPATVEASGASLLAACAGRVLDGVALYQDLVAGSIPSLDPTTDAALKPVYLAFTEWVVDVVGNIGSSNPANWDRPELRYSISRDVTALPDGRPATLSVEPDRAAELEWYSFDLVRAKSAQSPAPLIRRSLLPIHVRFRGMPNDRFWDFESNKTEYGNVMVDVPDAGRLLFLDFMLIHGAGWYVAPLDVAVGAFCQVDSLIVHDVFGGVTSIPRADAELGPAGARSTLFSTTDLTTGGVTDFLFVPPTCGAATQKSSPIEDVRLFRDDAADLAWAVEDLAPDAVGKTRHGYERGALPLPPAPLPIIRYELQTPVPPAWFPLLPEESQGSLVDFVAAPIAGSSLQPWGRIVPSLAGAAVPEQAVPRAGLRLQRVYCRSRWLDGSTYLWIARRRVLGARGPSSGLVYDQVLPASS
jgi:hypothetical protein